MVIFIGGPLRPEPVGKIVCILYKCVFLLESERKFE